MSSGSVHCMTEWPDPIPSILRLRFAKTDYKNHLIERRKLFLLFLRFDNDIGAGRYSLALDIPETGFADERRQALLAIALSEDDVTQAPEKEAVRDKADAKTPDELP